MWSQKGFNINGENIGDQFGYSVSLSSDGNTVAISSINNGTNHGNVRVYTFNNSNWTQKGNDISGEDIDDQSGWSVSLSSDGNTIAIGSPSNDGVNGSNSGHVRVYTYNNTDWIQKGNDIDGESTDDQSGWSIMLSDDGNTVAIGSPSNDGVNGSNSGHVRVYTFNNSTWTQKGSDIDGEALDDKSGFSVSLSSDGNTVAIGSPFNYNLNEPHTGKVRIYTFNTIDWVQKGNDIIGDFRFINLGWSVSLSSDGNTVAIGIIYSLNPNIQVFTGSVIIYNFNNNNWEQKGNKIEGNAGGSEFGYSVSLSSDGNTVAIGGLYTDGIEILSGQVQVYTFNNPSWVQKGNNLNGEATNDKYGYSVSLSADGNTVSIGAPNKDGNGLDSGYVRVYTFSGTDLPIISSIPDQTELASVVDTLDLTTYVNLQGQNLVGYFLVSPIPSGITIDQMSGLVTRASYSTSVSNTKNVLFRVESSEGSTNGSFNFIGNPETQIINNNIDEFNINICLGISYNNSQYTNTNKVKNYKSFQNIILTALEFIIRTKFDDYILPDIKLINDNPINLFKKTDPAQTENPNSKLLEDYLLNDPLLTETAGVKITDVSVISFINTLSNFIYNSIRTVINKIISGTNYISNGKDLNNKLESRIQIRS